MHLKSPFATSMQVDPNAQGLDLHELILIWQLGPVNPAEHSHLYQFTPSMHLPPFWQGLDAQSLMFTSHLFESQPSLHMQLCPSPEFMQAASFRQGDDVHACQVAANCQTKALIFIKSEYKSKEEKLANILA